MKKSNDSVEEPFKMVVRVKENVLFNGKGSYAAVFEALKKGENNVPVVLFFPNSPCKYPHPTLTMHVEVVKIMRKEYEERCQDFLNQCYWRKEICYKLDKETMKDMLKAHRGVSRQYSNGKYYMVRYRKVCHLNTFFVSKPNLLSSRLKKHYQYHFHCSIKSVKKLLHVFYNQAQRIKFSTKRDMLCEYAQLLQRPTEYFQLCSYFSGPCMWWCFKEEYLCKRANEFLDYVEENKRVLDQFLYYGSPFTKDVVYDKRIEECLELWQYVPKCTPKVRTEKCLKVYKSFLKERNTNGNWLIDCSEDEELEDDSDEKAEKQGEEQGEEQEEEQEAELKVPKETVLRYLTRNLNFREPVLVRVNTGMFSFFEDYALEKELFDHFREKHTVLLDQQLSKDFQSQVRNGTVLLEYPNECIKEQSSDSIFKACKIEKEQYDRKKILERDDFSVCFVLCDYFSLSKLNKLFQLYEKATKFFVLFSDPLQFISAKDLLPNWRHEIKEWTRDKDTSVLSMTGMLDDPKTLKGVLQEFQLFTKIPDGIPFSLLKTHTEQEWNVSSGTEFMKKVNLDSSYVLVPNKGLKKKIIDKLRQHQLYYGYRDETKNTFRKEGYAKGSLVRTFEERPRLYLAQSAKRWEDKNNQVVTIATVAEVAVFGQRENVYLVGGNWEPSALQAAKALASKNVFTLTLNNVESVWNFKAHGKESKKHGCNRSAFYWLTVQSIKDEIMEKDKKVFKKRKAQEERDKENKKLRSQHLKRKSRELYNDKNPNNKVRIL